MKKILAILSALVLAGGVLSAQPALGGGYVNSTKTSVFTASDGTQSTSARSYHGVYVGVYDRIGFGPGFAFTPGLYYSFAMYRAEGEKSFPIVGTLYGDVTEMEHMVNMPMNFEYGMVLAAGKVRPYVFAGCTPQYTVSSKTKLVLAASTIVGDMEKEYAEDHLGEDGSLKPLDVMVGGGLGIDLINMVRIHAGYNYGLLNRSTAQSTVMHRTGWYAGVSILF